MVAALQLTPEQRDGIRAIEDEAFFAMLPHDGAADQRGRPGPQAKDRPANERILALLTEEQARRWEAMTGPPFKGVAGAFSPAVRAAAPAAAMNGATGKGRASALRFV